MSFISSIIYDHPFYTGLLLLLCLSIPLSFFFSIQRSYRHDVVCITYSRWLGHLPFMLHYQGKTIDQFYQIFCQLYKKHKTFNTIFYMPFSVPYIFTSDPKNIEYILKTNFKNYVKGPVFFKKGYDLLGHGIFNVDGEAWKVQRKSASLIFNVKNFRDFMMQVFIEHAQTLCDKLNEAVQQESIIDLYDLLLRFTLDAFMEIGMGCHLNSLKQETQSPFAIAFDRAQAIIALRITQPIFVSTILETLNGSKKELKKCIKVIHSFAEQFIQERKRMKPITNQMDLLSRFIYPHSHVGSEFQFSDQELRDIAINFIIAGRDTTAQALSWCIYLLCQHPHVVLKLRKEIKAVCKGTPEPLTYDNVKSLSYAQAVFKESLRLYPSVPKELKYAVDEDTWPDGTYIPPGQAVLWIPYAMGRLEYLWGPDALEFKPERWQAQPPPSPYKYPVFNAGPRVCLGQQMALLEGVFCLAKLVQSYDFELVNLNEVTYTEGLTLQMKNGLRVRVKSHL